MAAAEFKDLKSSSVYPLSSSAVCPRPGLKTHVQDLDGKPALRALVLVPVRQRVQLQLSEEFADISDPGQTQGRAPGNPDYARRRSAGVSVFHPVVNRR